jgi:hypothetical protein
VVHQYRQAKFAYGGSILSLIHFLATGSAAFKNNARYKSFQN